MVIAAHMHENSLNKGQLVSNEINILCLFTLISSFLISNKLNNYTRVYHFIFI